MKRRSKTDVAIVGSGAAGLTAALSVASAGARVKVIECAPVLGGTSAVSGASMWVPNNRFMRASGVSDSDEEALAYVRAISLGRSPDPLLETFVAECNHLVAFLLANTGLEFAANLDHPDYQPGLQGACRGGRTLQCGLYDSKSLKDYRQLLRIGWTQVPLTKFELDAWGRETPENWDWELVAERRREGIVGLGSALIGHLLEACLDRGVEFHLGHRARRLIDGPSGVTGLTVDGPELDTIRTEAGVVLASGGFEWNRALVDTYLGVPMDAPGSPPFNRGDALHMCTRVGASLSMMSEAWWTAMVAVPGDSYDDAPLYRPSVGLQGRAGAIVINREGRRFANEACNYHDFGKAMQSFDPQRYRFPNAPAYLVFDGEFRSRNSVFLVNPDMPTPEWMIEAKDLQQLADAIQVEREVLEDELAIFNDAARQGYDPAFGRGTSVYDHYRGDERCSPNVNLRPLKDPPFFAVQIHLGCLGTKGGAATDQRARVLDTNGQPIGGLYACGNAAGNVFGPGYPGAGAPLASGMTFGMLAGSSIVG